MYIITDFLNIVRFKIFTEIMHLNEGSKHNEQQLN